jgi:hypothetical protein
LLTANIAKLLQSLEVGQHQPRQQSQDDEQTRQEEEEDDPTLASSKTLTSTWAKPGKKREHGDAGPGEISDRPQKKLKDGEEVTAEVVKKPAQRKLEDYYQPK